MGKQDDEMALINRDDGSIDVMVKSDVVISNEAEGVVIALGDDERTRIVMSSTEAHYVARALINCARVRSMHGLD